jgi:RHS repeat-associated protein
VWWSKGRLYLALHHPTTKHYYADGRLIATRRNDELYYVHSDPLGSTTLFTDQGGEAIGTLRYGPMGAVISNTLPARLNQSLVSQLEANSGLQYDGQRYYDPWVGGYIQPNPFGGAPGVPQSLNRFALGSGSGVSGALAPGGSGNPLLVVDIGKAVLGEVRDEAIGSGLVLLTNKGLRSIRAQSRIRVPPRTIQVSREIIENIAINQTADDLLGLGYLGLNRLRGKMSSALFNAAQGVLDDALIANTRQVRRIVWETVVKHPAVGYRFTRTGRLAGLLLYSKYGKHAFDLGTGFGVDFFAGAIIQGISDQYYYDLWSNNPGLAGQRVFAAGGKELTYGAIGVGTSGLVALGFFAAGASPPGLLLVGTAIGVSVIVNIADDYSSSRPIHNYWFNGIDDDQIKEGFH